MPARSVTLVLLCAVVVVAGCTGVPRQSTPTAPTPSEPIPTPLPGVTPAAYTAELAIENPSRQSITVQVYEQSADGAPTTATDALVVNRTTDQSRIHLDDAFESQTDYWVVVEVNGTARWNDTVYDYESYTLSVERDGTVRIAGLAVR